MSIEPKVKAATSGATVAAGVCWLLTHYVTHGALPVPVEGLVDMVVPGAVAFLGGYLARHVERPSATVPVSLALRVDSGQLAATIAQHVRSGLTQLASTTPDPARPPEAAQHTETTNPEGNTGMSLLTKFETLVEELRGKMIGKVGAEVSDDVHAAIDEFKGQGAQLLTEAGHDAQADAAEVAGDTVKVATDAEAAVAPSPAAPVETPTTPPATPTA
jgi:hypothetical protein